MVLSQKRKRELRKLMNWRSSAKNGNRKCRKCGKSISKTIHHFFCNVCWKERNEVL
jgi:Zn finger protein HypA/HybF involved in hydrogenase expression